MRAEAAALRRKVWLSSGASASQAIARVGLQLIGAMQFVPAVGGYFPVRDELDPLPLLQALHDRGLRLALPATQPGLALAFREWVPGGPLERGKFGLQEPAGTHCELQPNLLLVPLLAFDRSGNRLGYGAGYYDAALRNLRRRGTVIAIGVGFDEQEFPDIPREPQDEPLDLILTPTRVIACGE
ncbi:MAG: 5-formyltetrahydrofolate cyclo-ligase [Rhodomicrobium sp.]